MIYCEDCKYAVWEARLFAEFWFDELFVLHTYREQWDCSCSLHNTFFLQEEAPDNCPDGVFGDNNMNCLGDDNIAKEFYDMRDRYVSLIDRCRKLHELEIKQNVESGEITEKDIDDAIIDLGSDKDEKMCMDYIREHDAELYKKVTESKTH